MADADQTPAPPSPSPRIASPRRRATGDIRASRSTIRPSERGWRVERRDPAAREGRGSSARYLAIADLDSRPTDDELRARYGGGVYRVVDQSGGVEFRQIAGPIRSDRELFGAPEELPAVVEARAALAAARVERDAAIAREGEARVEVVRLGERLAARDAEIERLTGELEELREAVVEVEVEPPGDPIERLLGQVEAVEALRGRLAPPRENPGPPPVDWGGLIKGLAPAIPGLLGQIRQALTPPPSPWAALEAAGLTPAQVVAELEASARARAAAAASASASEARG